MHLAFSASSSPREEQFRSIREEVELANGWFIVSPHSFFGLNFEPQTPNNNALCPTSHTGKYANYVYFLSNCWQTLRGTSLAVSTSILQNQKYQTLVFATFSEIYKIYILAHCSTIKIRKRVKHVGTFHRNQHNLNQSVDFVVFCQILMIFSRSLVEKSTCQFSKRFCKKFDTRWFNYW